MYVQYAWYYNKRVYYYYTYIGFYRIPNVVQVRITGTASSGMRYLTVITSHYTTWSGCTREKKRFDFQLSFSK